MRCDIAVLLLGEKKLSKNVRLFIGMLLCIMMVLTSVVSVMAAAGGTDDQPGRAAAEEPANEGSGSGKEGVAPEAAATGNSSDNGDNEDAAGDGAAPDEKADKDSGESEKAKEAADGNDSEKKEEEKASASTDADGKKPAAKGLSLKAVPGDNVTSEVWMGNGETKSDSFTIENGGVVLGPGSGSATIKDGTVTNNAKNGRIGGVTGSDGSAFISTNGGALNFENETINTSNKSLVINIWQNATANVTDTTLDGSNIDYGDLPFLLVGGSNGAGTLNFRGNSTIQNTKAEIRSLHNSSQVNVQSGTLTLENSRIGLNNTTITVKSGAVLRLDKTTLDLSNNTERAAIVVEEGGTLVLDGSKIDPVSGAFGRGIIVSSGTVEIKGSTISGITKTSGDSSIIEIKKGDLTITDSVFEDNIANNSKGGVILANGAGTVTINGTSKFNNNNSGNSQIYVGDSYALIISGEATFNDNTSRPKGKEDTNGGAVYAYRTPVNIGDEVSFKGNMAKFGGAIYLEECSGTKIGKAVFEENGSRFTDSTWNNAITMDGGAMYIRGGTAELNGTVFRKNLAATASNSSGGAAYIYGASVNVNGAEISNNQALIRGGGMTVAHDSHVHIGDLDGTPTRFTDNFVEFGTDHAGGGLFINNAYVSMEDAAIYGNAAEDAGGGISTCTTGTAEARVLDGAAIFDNRILAGNHEHGAGHYPPVEDIQKYRDVFLQTSDHRDAETGEIIPGRDGFPTYDYELYERMFNGGIHRWSVRPVVTQNDDGHKLNSLVAQSDPSNKDIKGAKVVFTGNQAWRHPDYTTTVSGGAIACNGLLEIGTGRRTEIKIVKRWDDRKDADKLRPDYSEYISELKLWSENDGSRHYIRLPEVHNSSSGQPVATGYDRETGISVDVFTEGSFTGSGNVAENRGTAVEANGDEWVIIISGLPVPEKGSYGCGESEIPGYRITEEYSDPEKGYFEFTNRHHVSGKTVSVTVNKIWKGDNLSVRPESIEMYLLADGKEIQKKTVSASDNWICSFDGLPYARGEGDNQEVIRYTIVEGSPDNYIPSYKTSREDPYDITETVTNTYHKGYGALTVSKYWDDDNDRGGIRPESIEVSLLRQVGDGPVEDTGKKLVLSKKDNWDPVVFAEIPLTEDGETIHYTVKEIAVADGYFAEIDHRFEDHHFAEIFNHLKAGKKGKGNTDTGDRNELAAWCSVLVMAGAGAAVVYSKRRKKKQ